MIQQTGGATPQSSLELVLSASPETKIVLVILTIFSLVSWFIIILKWWQFRKLNRQADRFFREMERTTRLQDAYKAVMKLPPSPYNRLFREAITFYSELRPGALRWCSARKSRRSGTCWGITFPGWRPSGPSVRSSVLPAPSSES